ncbi:glycoside hydrolase family 5 protein [Roseateles sp. LYH14W]|uniref:Glycoside hydrolase family 5 protein n=1 Tax=Pelomonas parva TaxID=3299032 RepID=A0ABW7EZY0_9BURK
MKLPLLGAALLALLPLFASAYEPKVAAPAPTDAGEWWNVPYALPFDAKQLTRKQSEVKVKGNLLVDDSGRTVVFRGVNIADPDKLVKQGKWSKAHFEAAKSFGSNIVRLPVHPIAWRSRGSENYLKLIDQAVVWANELDLYLIVDWHSMGNPTKELYFHPMYVTSKQETREFWRQIAARYAGIPTIAVYELFNEPTINSGKLGEVDWQEWKAFNEELISIIYAHDKGVIPLVAGFNWAYDLSQVAQHPIAREGVAYAIHPYPQKSSGPFPEAWEKAWGYLSEKYPLMATEIGWMRADEKGAHRPVISDGSYGPLISDYFAKKGISFTVWAFDPDWPPQMISDWNYTPTGQGKFFREFMLKQAEAEAKTKAVIKP